MEIQSEETNRSTVEGLDVGEPKDCCQTRRALTCRWVGLRRQVLWRLCAKFIRVSTKLAASRFLSEWKAVYIIILQISGDLCVYERRLKIQSFHTHLATSIQILL